jgi:general secretion pathway protein G
MARLGAARCGSVVRSGFTLIELVITVAIVAILASAVVPLNELVVTRSKEQDLRRSLRDIREAIDAYKQAWDEGRIVRQPAETGYPKSLDVLTDGVEDIKNPKKAKIYFLRRLPRDPFAVDSSVSSAATWGKRSYASAPDDPKEGEDVFDVYSLTAGKGLNGRPYREW